MSLTKTQRELLRLLKNKDCYITEKERYNGGYIYTIYSFGLMVQGIKVTAPFIKNFMKKGWIARHSEKDCTYYKLSEYGRTAMMDRGM